MSFFADVLRWFTTSAHWHGTNGIPHRMFEHIELSAFSVAVAALVAIPAGIVAGHSRWAKTIAVNVANIGRAIPSFAILVIAVQQLGIGARPTFIALVALAVPPMVTNAVAGVRSVDRDVIDAARGMGLSGMQVLRRVEAPLAIPLVMAGVRTAAVQVVATATLAAVVAWGGLGRYIIDGFAQRDNVQVFSGAVLVAALAVITEFSLGRAQRIVTPRGLRSDQDGTAKPVVIGPGVARPVE